MEYSVEDSRIFVMKSTAARGSSTIEASNSFVPLTGARPKTRVLREEALPGAWRCNTTTSPHFAPTVVAIVMAIIHYFIYNGPNGRHSVKRRICAIDFVLRLLAALAY